MITWLAMTVTGYLLLVLQESSTGLEITERRLAAEGSSVLMHAPDTKNVNITEWEYTRTSTPEFILQCYEGCRSPTIYPAYQGRVVFYPNGSILLQKLREADSGTYKATINLRQDKARTTLLQVIKPVPQPQLQHSLSLAGLPIELVCVVPEGTVASISWKKEGRPLPPEKCYVPSENMTVLQIRNGEKSDCGSYSCNISNEISWKEAALNLTVTGLTPRLQNVQRLAIATLIFIAASTISIVILFCQLREQSFANKPTEAANKKSSRTVFAICCCVLLPTRSPQSSGVHLESRGEALGPAGRFSRKEAQNHIILCTHGLLFVSSALLLACSVIWMQEEGLSAAFLLLGLFFLAAVIATAQVGAAVLWKPAALQRFKIQMRHHVTRNSTATTILIVNLLFTTLLLHQIQQLHERGCSEATDPTIACVSAAAAILVMLLLLLLSYHRSEWKKARENRRAARSADVTSTLVIEEPQGRRQEGQ